MEAIKNLIWGQAGASIDMLRNAIRSCPDPLWDNGTNYWYIAYHTLFFIDYYLSENPTEFHPPAPFTMSEMDPSGAMPDRTYTKEELLTYADHCRKKCYERTMDFDETSAFSPVRSYNKTYPAIELVLTTTRHVQHHTAQLNLMIRQDGAEPPRWVYRAEESEANLFFSKKA